MWRVSSQLERQISSTWVVAAGGLLLALLTLWLHPSLTIAQIRWSYPLVCLGAAVFGLILAERLDLLPAVPMSGPKRLADLLGLEPKQLIGLLLALAFALLARLAAGDAGLARSLPISLAAWLLAGGFAVWGSWRRPTEPPISPSWTRLDWLWCGALLAFALLLRATFLESVPDTLSGDEGSVGLVAIQFLEGEVNNLFNLGWFSFPSFYFWLQSWGIALLGQTTAGLRIGSAVAGALTVPALYWLVWHLYGRTAAVAAGCLLAASHFHVHFSRIGLNNIWDGLFAVLVLGTLWRGWRSGSRTWFIVCGLLLGLSQYFYVSMRPVPLLLLVWSGCALWLDPVTFRRRLPDLALTAFIALIVYLPLALYFLVHLDEFNAPMQRASIVFDGWLDGVVAQTGWGKFRILLDQLRRSAFGITHIPLRSWYTPDTGLLPPVPAMLFAGGLLVALRRIKLQGLLLLVPLAGTVLVGAFSQNMPAAQRYVIVSPLAIALAGLAAGRLTDYLRRRVPDRPAVPTVVLALLLLGLMAYDINLYFREVPKTFTLGGINTLVATTVADRFKPQDDGDLTIYFVGAPRMTYRSHSTIPYLLPQTRGFDILEPLTGPPVLHLTGKTIFVVLPERLPELDYIQRAFPGGRLDEINDDHGSMLFATYTFDVSSES